MINMDDSIIHKYYMVFVTQNKQSWRIFDTELDLDYAEDLEKWIEYTENVEQTSICPIYWKKLKIKPSLPVVGGKDERCN